MIHIVTAVARPVPTVFDGTANTVAVVVLLLEFGMLRSSLFGAQVRLYAAQSVAVSVLAAVVAIGRGVPELFILAALSCLLKAVIVPLVMMSQLRESRAEIAGSGALGVASDVAGPNFVDPATTPTMGGEDFSYMLNARPGNFIFIGNGDTAGLHNPNYDFNDEIIPYGVSYWVKLAETRLTQLA